jgi:hypothetical protein
MTDELSRFDPLRCVQRVRSETVFESRSIAMKSLTNNVLSTSGGKGIRTPDPLHAMPTFLVRRWLLVSSRALNH